MAHILALQIRKFRLLVEQVGLEVLVAGQMLVILGQQEVRVGLVEVEEAEVQIMEQVEMALQEQHFQQEGVEAAQTMELVGTRLQMEAGAGTHRLDLIQVHVVVLEIQVELRIVKKDIVRQQLHQLLKTELEEF
jgi:hypothetical protein